MKDFFALRTIASIFRILGIINIIITVLLVLFLLLSPDSSVFGQISLFRGVNILGIILLLFLSLLPALLLFAISETILLFLKIEKNTRRNESVDKSSMEISNVTESLNSDFQEWKKNNPYKTINEYYQSKR